MDDRHDRFQVGGTVVSEDKDNALQAPPLSWYVFAKTERERGISLCRNNSPDDNTPCTPRHSETSHRRGHSVTSTQPHHRRAPGQRELNQTLLPDNAASTMGKIGKEVSGQVVSFIGLIGVSVTCGIPMWRVTTFIGANIVTGQIIWDGLWMNCVMQSTGQMQCKLNESVMRLSRDLQAARALVIIALIFGFLGLMATFIGAKCMGCLKTDASRSKVVILGGCLIIFTAVLILIPVCWSAAITITDFQNPLTIETQRREIGASIYIGWASAALLLVGGIIFTTSCPPQRPMYGYPGYGPAPIYPYPGVPVPNPATYGPMYAPPSRAYSGTGSYAPSKPYGAPTVNSARQYL